jgi:hypothetical protein
MFMDEGNEAKSFPTLFPHGTQIFTDKRPEKLTLNRYLNCRILSADNRFAKCTDYIFYAQYLKELEQVWSSVSIALRKGKRGGRNEKLTIEAVRSKDKLNEIFGSDEGYKFLKPVHGSPAYWQAVQKDLFAMIRQLGIPTWFCSFSSADLRWTEMIDAILRQQSDKRKASKMTWEEKCEVLRSNPVSVARMFDHRFNHFLKKVIMSPSNPIGKVVDHFYRIEFQQRGSPHTHCLFWIEGAPKLHRESDDEVSNFIDKYVTCKLPISNEDSEMCEIVSSVQKHSKKHSKSCKKNKSVCRFNFPRPPSKRTFIARPPDDDDTINDISSTTSDDDLEEAIEEVTKRLAEKERKKKFAQNLIQTYWKALTAEGSTHENINALFDAMNIDQEDFESAYNELNKKPSIVLRRDVDDMWIHQYNEDLLRC